MSDAHHAELIARAEGNAARAYAPYSHFRVGAVAVARSGEIYDGANVENAAFPSTLCAEAVAIGSAAAAGERELDTIAVVCLDATEACYPCGQCRQRMREFSVRRVVVTEPDGTITSHTLDALLPHSFGPEHLPSP